MTYGWGLLANFRLVGSLRDKSRKALEDLEALESVENEVRRLKDRLDEEHRKITLFYVYGADQDSTESELSSLRSDLEGLIDSAKGLSGSTKARYQASQQLVPSDLAQQLTVLELTAENTGQAMEEKQREQKRARTTRTEYIGDVDELQSWIRQAELKVQDRSIEPSILRESLRQIQSELGPMSDKLERLTRNGQNIVENTRDEEEKELIGKTIGNLTEQLSQVRSWLDEKKQQVGDILDAWQRFMVLYEAVKSWTEEKRVFLEEPLSLTSLIQTRQRLHDYSVRRRSTRRNSPLHDRPTVKMLPWIWIAFGKSTSSQRVDMEYAAPTLILSFWRLPIRFLLENQGYTCRMESWASVGLFQNNTISEAVSS